MLTTIIYPLDAGHHHVYPLGPDHQERARKDAAAADTSRRMSLAAQMAEKLAQAKAQAREEQAMADKLAQADKLAKAQVREEAKAQQAAEREMEQQHQQLHARRMVVEQATKGMKGTKGTKGEEQPKSGAEEANGDAEQARKWGQARKETSSPTDGRKSPLDGKRTSQRIYPRTSLAADLGSRISGALKTVEYALPFSSPSPPKIKKIGVKTEGNGAGAGAGAGEGDGDGEGDGAGAGAGGGAGAAVAESGERESALSQLGEQDRKEGRHAEQRPQIATGMVKVQGADAGTAEQLGQDRQQATASPGSGSINSTHTNDSSGLYDRVDRNVFDNWKSSNTQEANERACAINSVCAINRACSPASAEKMAQELAVAKAELAATRAELQSSFAREAAGSQHSTNYSANFSSMDEPLYSTTTPPPVSPPPRASPPPLPPPVSTLVHELPKQRPQEGEWPKSSSPTEEEGKEGDDKLQQLGQHHRGGGSSGGRMNQLNQHAHGFDLDLLESTSMIESTSLASTSTGESINSRHSR
jgi:hypothetical protein